MSTPFEDGYHSGLVNDRECPYSAWDLRSVLWALGNLTGLDVHCAVVEAVYLREEG